jgi:hypothetical protein
MDPTSGVMVLRCSVERISCDSPENPGSGYIIACIKNILGQSVSLNAKCRHITGDCGITAVVNITERKQ